MDHVYQGRVSQSQYWTAFGINVVACLFLAVSGFTLIISGSIVAGFLLILCVIPVGIYFRVIMMRRCRDIGWPPSLPWIMLGVGFFANAANILGGGRADAAEITAASVFGLPLIVGLLDFALMIVMGCIRGRGSDQNYWRAHDEEGVRGQGSVRLLESDHQGHMLGSTQSPRHHFATADPGNDHEARWDDAIAQALARHQQGSTGPSQASGSPATSPITRGPPRPAGGFGRRGV